MTRLVKSENYISRSLRLWRFGRRSQARTRARARLEEDSAESVRTPNDDDDDDGRSVGGDSQATLRMSGSLCSPEGRAAVALPGEGVGLAADGHGHALRGAVRGEVLPRCDL